MSHSLLPYYFFRQNYAAQVFLYRFFTGFAPDFEQKSKKICQFFAIFSLCVSMIYEKVEKKVSQKT